MKETYKRRQQVKARFRRGKIWRALDLSSSTSAAGSGVLYIFILLFTRARMAHYPRGQRLKKNVWKMMATKRAAGITRTGPRLLRLTAFFFARAVYSNETLNYRMLLWWMDYHYNNALNREREGERTCVKNKIFQQV